MQESQIRQGTSWFNINGLPWIMVGLGALFYSYESLLRQSPSVMNAELMHHYHIGAGNFAHLVAYYYYIYAPMQLFVGLLMDKYGPKRLLTFAAFACALGSYLFVASDQLLLAEAGRFIVGLGSSFAFVGVLKLATLWLPSERFAIVSGSAMSLGMIGCLFGDVGLTTIVDHIGWRSASYYASLFGVIIALFMFFMLKDAAQKTSKVQRNTVRLSVVDLLTAFSRLVRNPQIWINGFIGCLMWLPISIFAETWGVFYLENVHQLSRNVAGDACSMVFLGWAVGGPIVGWLSDRIQQRRILITLGAAVAAIMISIVLYLPDLDRVFLFPILFLFGLFNSAQVIVFAVGRELSTNSAAGTALALTNMLVMFAGVIQPVSGILLDWISSKAHAAQGALGYSHFAYEVALSILPIGLLLTVILSFFLKETYASDVDSHAH